MVLVVSQMRSVCDRIDESLGVFNDKPMDISKVRMLDALSDPGVSIVTSGFNYYWNLKAALCIARSVDQCTIGKNVSPKTLLSQI